MGVGRPVALVRDQPGFTRLTLAAFISSVGDPLSLTVSLVLLFTATRSPLSIAGAYLCQILSGLVVSSLLTPLADRVDRRRLIVRLELGRCLLVALLPLLTHVSVMFLYPALLLLGAAQALVQSGRQAAIPALVGDKRVGSANGTILAVTSVAQGAGFATAGFLIPTLGDPRLLYLGDAVSFAAAAGLVAIVGPMGGGLAATPIRGGLVRALRIPGAPVLLVVAGVANLCVGMLNPALLPLAYNISHSGPLVYGLLQVALIAGVLGGSLAAGRVAAPLTRTVLAVSIWTFAATVGLVGASTTAAFAIPAILLSGVGNAGYSVTNLSALMRLSEERNRGTVMGARVASTQAGNLVGLGVGAGVTTLLGPHATFFGAGVVLLALAAWYTATLLPRPSAQQPTV
ncbi:MAG: MFS transporter [Candidatus Dormibacteraeota bacterium]|nr:MFS transporter [Candidatus Dormibacteraeota bacterium]